MRHFLDLDPIGPDALRTILDEAKRRKAARGDRPKGAPDDDAPLAGHVLASIFEKTSTRTRLSFEIAMRQLGGSAITMATGDMQIGIGETIEDTARVLSRYVDVAQLRTDDHSKLTALAGASDIPVINGLTDDTHPCQIVADIMTVEERLGRDVKDTVWAWLGDGNNVCHSIIEAAGLLGFPLRLSTPESFEPERRYIDAAVKRGSSIEVIGKPADAVKGADVVVTDTWISMGDTDRDARLAALTPFQVNEGIMAGAKADAIFLHCLPAHRGEEVTDAVIDGPQSAVFDEAENRVHAQKAVLLWCLEKI